MPAKIGKGVHVRVRGGVTAPEFPDIQISGWSGTVSDVSGRKDKRKVFIEWDGPTLEQMPGDYLAKCEERQLYHIMACLTENDLEPTDD